MSTEHGAGGLEADRVVIRAGGSLIIDDVDCTAPAGAFTALIGPNGAGKSTLLRVLAAVDRPTDGVVRSGGTDLHRLPRRTRARRIALVEQDAATELGLTVREVVELGRIPFQSMFGSSASGSSTSGEVPTDDAAIVDDALRRTRLEPFAGRDVTTLSGGERQRVMLAKALAQQPRLLLLDEPTNHLDIAAQLDVLAVLDGLARDGVTVLAALHDLTLAAAWSDHVIVLSGGRVVAAGPTAQVLTPQLVGDVYGVDATVLEHPGTGRPLIAFSRR